LANLFCQRVVRLFPGVARDPTTHASCVPEVNNPLTASLPNTRHWDSALPWLPRSRLRQQLGELGYGLPDAHLVAFPPSDAVGGNAEALRERRLGEAQAFPNCS